PPRPLPSTCPITTVSADGTTWVAIQGRATWQYAAALREVCLGGLDAGRAVVLDLAACVMLDSTILGTLHELAGGRAGTLRLQNVPEEIRRLFVELQLTQVLACIADAPWPLPGGMAPVEVRGDAA